jgi:hypothetical protein
MYLRYVILLFEEFNKFLELLCRGLIIDGYFLAWDVAESCRQDFIAGVLQKIPYGNPMCGVSCDVNRFPSRINILCASINEL